MTHSSDADTIPQTEGYGPHYEDPAVKDPIREAITDGYPVAEHMFNEVIP